MYRAALTLTSLIGLLAAVPAAGADATAAPPTPAVAVSGLPDNMPPAALRPEPSLPVPLGWPFPDAFPHTSGTFRLIGGALEWSDFLYDDHGAAGARVAPPLVPLAPTYGTYVYPDGAAHGDGADVFRAAVGLDDGATYWRVDWNTLADPRIPVAEFALNTGDHRRAKGREWPAGAGIRSPGIDTALLVSSRGAWLIDVVGGARVSLSPYLSVDRSARSFVVRVPRTMLEPSGTWRVRLAAGLATAAGDGFAPVGIAQGAVPGQPAVYDVAFRSHTVEPVSLAPTGSRPIPPNFWREAAQATALASHDVSSFGVDVHWDDLARHTTTPEPAPRGFSDRWYVSSIELGQGVVAHKGGDGVIDLAPTYLGRVQPYSVYVPSTYDGSSPLPLTWMLHSLFQQHNAFVSITPEFVQQACEARRSICVTPLGRGHDGFYLDAAELDFWEVWNRVAGAYRLDPTRTEIAGFSMGGYAAYRIGLAHPDLFAHATVLAGTPLCGRVLGPGVNIPFARGRCTTDGDTGPLVENARWLPYFIAHGTADEVLPIPGTLEQVDRLDRLGYRHRFEHYLGQAHIPWYAQDAWSSAALHMGTGPATTDPGHITYRWYPDLDRPEWGLQATGAYWIRSVAARHTEPGALARVDADSLARPDPATWPERTRGVMLSTQASPASVSEVTWSAGVVPPRRAYISFGLTDVAALGVDLIRAGILPGEAATFDVRSDGPSSLTLIGLRVGSTILVDGVRAAMVGHEASAAVMVTAGAHQVSVR